ncbi:hypothetical protein GBA52_008859 [Prunus armeniaca]|nr:hypothetical protein GBA52_008859 [Prunus armeniaca]
MKLVEESESIRAQRLHERIKQSKRILIILDDVWSAIIKPNDESVNKTKETRNDIQVAGSTSSRSKVAQVK